MAVGFKLTLALIVSAVFCAAMVDGLTCKTCKGSPEQVEESGGCKSVKCPAEGLVCKRSVSRLPDGKVVGMNLGCAKKPSGGKTCSEGEPKTKHKIVTTTCTCNDKDDCNENEIIANENERLGKDEVSSSGKLLGWSTLTLCTISSIFAIFSQVVFMGGQ